MATLQTLYNNIKTLITKYFEEKTIEDKTLPQWVELYFDYNNQGELSINDAPNTQNTLNFTFEGTTLSQYPSGAGFSGSNMFIDYGDGSIEKTTGRFDHTYEENKTYKVRIYGITALETFCFQNCTGLTSIILPNNITNLAAIVFGGCSDLASIIIPDSVTNIGTQCFKDCVSLTSIILPDSVTNIGSSCFRSCTGLTSVTLPNNVTSLGDYCFRYCTNLTEIILQWDSSSEIISYNSSWIDGCTLFDHFLIPEDTTQLYIDAGYPSELLQESD